ncbi:uroporphyrinogen decarboxylase [Adhaeretor mobilis]|uniref:Uroporphyrinogen decarboxylase n=1 Tax=Adhaeretor mobilis TaxID=1930276 RepID=A0A517N2Y1_9BACT|nr:uroporphyrinogen decarboxylase [Adhaeretor mobilis]QDT01358.1 Uroporphyrinogen decarboxylase [Adhaeretor mobilis]
MPPPPPQQNFQQRCIVALESRRAEDTQRMIERFEGRAFVSPSMREAPVEAEGPLVDFAHRLITGQVDVMILLTGVGTRQFIERVESRVDRERLVNALADIQTVARGPKPQAALRELGISATIVVPEPNTWREILETLDKRLPVTNLNVAIQEYGIPNISLTAGLEARGATVEAVKIYRWELPTDLGPLKQNVQRLAQGEVDLALFTSGQQVVHLLEIAQQLDLEAEVRKAFQQTVVASIGPTTSEALRDRELPVDFEPSHPKLGHLISESAEASAELIARKNRVQCATANQQANRSAPWYDSPFMKACRREPVPYTPVWLMRQAGRYMSEYREVRAKTTFLELCKNPKLCSEVMCTAVDKLGVDAAIIFSDLLPILEPMGFDLEFTPGDGPQIHNPVRTAGDLSRVVELENLDSLDFVFETVSQTRTDLPEDLPLIGFAGAPFTLASYAIEGGSSRSFLHTKKLMYTDSASWNELLGRLSRSITRYLNAQIAAGAQVVQLFDSWVGCLGPHDYRTYVMPHVSSIIAGITPGTPVIHFGTGNPTLLPLQAEAGGDVIGVDWRIDLADAWKRIGYDHAVQGNLDPLTLLADEETLRERVQGVLTAADNRPGHIFNLGHGVLKQTPVENAQAVVKLVQELSKR